LGLRGFGTQVDQTAAESVPLTRTAQP